MKDNQREVIKKAIDDIVKAHGCDNFITAMPRLQTAIARLDSLLQLDENETPVL